MPRPAHHSSSLRTSHHKIPTVMLHIGDVHASDEPCIIKTVLGSCVSACLYDPTTQIGGMNHFLLPGDAADLELSTRYGVNAMEVLINEMMKLGADRKRFKAKIFGGADIFQPNHQMLMVGSKNITFVRNFLETEGIPIANERVGGVEGVILHYYSATFDVMVKRLPSTKVRETEKKESQYQKRITTEIRKKKPDNVTIF